MPHLLSRLLAGSVLGLALTGCTTDSADGPPTTQVSTTRVIEQTPPTSAPATTPPTTSAPGPHTGTERADALFGELLKAAVSDSGLVRYEVLRDRSPDLRSVVATYATTPKYDDQAAQLAFWCNAYNANVLWRVIEAQKTPGFESVIKVDGFFDKAPIQVGGESITLNQLENDRIRPLKDARIHAALVCGAWSCPPLRAEPYAAATLDAQFDDQCRRWVNDVTKFNVSGGTIGMSKILEWYGDDFTSPPYATPIQFIKAFARSGSALATAARPGVNTTWLEYDWKLNQAP